MASPAPDFSVGSGDVLSWLHSNSTSFSAISTSSRNTCSPPPPPKRTPSNSQSFPRESHLDYGAMANVCLDLVVYFPFYLLIISFCVWDQFSSAWIISFKIPLGESVEWISSFCFVLKDNFNEHGIGHFFLQLIEDLLLLSNFRCRYGKFSCQMTCHLLDGSLSFLLVYFQIFFLSLIYGFTIVCLLGDLFLLNFLGFTELSFLDCWRWKSLEP